MEWAGVVLGLAMANALHAQDSVSTNVVTATNTTVITSEKLAFDYKRSIAEFEGNVVVEDPRIRILSDKLSVIFDKTNSVKWVTAVGNVRMWHQDREATCQKAMYSAVNGEVTLTGDAVLKRGNNSLAGSTITFWLDKDTVNCEKGRLTLEPGADGGSLVPKELKSIQKPSKNE